MKAYLINMHLLLPRSRSSAKVKVKYKDYISQKMAISGAFVFHKHILFLFTVLASTNISTKLGENICDHKILDEFVDLIRPELFKLSALESENLP